MIKTKQQIIVLDKHTKQLTIVSPTHGEFKVLYDAEDEDKISEYTWHAAKNTTTDKFYIRAHVPHPSGDWYYRPGGRRSRRQAGMPLHRLIMNTPKGMQTDHINGDTLDNRKQNLRICTAAENQRNRGPTKNNKSGFKGVRWHIRDKKWCAAIRHEGINIHIGYFKDKEEAASAYDKKAIELELDQEKKFFKLNFPIEDYADALCHKN